MGCQYNGRLLKWNRDRPKTTAGKGKVSRQDFIQVALATGVSVAVAEIMFTDAVRAAPKTDGRLRMALGHGAAIDSLDPGTYTDQFMGSVSWGSAGR